MAELQADPGFVARFHAGERAILAACYDEYFDTADRAVGRVLAGPDRETVVQDVFTRLVGSASLRRNFGGGSFAAWIATVARNQAVDFLRKYQREVPLEEGDRADEVDHQFAERTEASMLVERFRREVLPEKWAPVFQARFLDQLSQREAATALGLHRTTLVYQELRIHALLRTFLVGTEEA